MDLLAARRGISRYYLCDTSCSVSAVDRALYDLHSMGRGLRMGREPEDYGTGVRSQILVGIHESGDAR